MAQTASQSSSPVGYLALLRTNRNFRLLWMGEVVSLFGDWFNLIGSAALLSRLTESGLAIGGLFVVRMLAPFLISPFAGVAADRYNRKWLLIVADILRTFVVLGFLFVRQPDQVWILYALTAIQLAISGIFFPARNAILPDIVSRRELGAANALASATWSVMLAVGAAVGGFVAGEWGIYPAFVIDSLTFLVSAFFLYQIRYIPSQLAGAGERSPGAVFAQYLEGLRYLKEHLDIFAITLQKAAISLTINGAFQVIMVLLAEQYYVIGEGGGTSLGLLFAISGVGTGLGPILVRHFTGDRDAALRWALLAAYGITVLGLVLIAPLPGFAIVLAGTFLRAFGGGINWVFSTQLLLQWVPDRFRGRVFSTEFALFTLANAISAAVGGWLLDNLGMQLRDLLWLFSGLTLLPGLLWAAWIVFGRRYSPPEAANPAAAYSTGAPED